MRSSTLINILRTLFLIVSCSGSSLFAQTLCDSLTTRYNTYKAGGFDEVETKSLTTQIKTCIEAMQEPKEKVLWSYNLVKLHLDQQNYADALSACEQCIVLSGKAYPKYASNCSAMRHALNGYTPYSSIGIGQIYSEKGDTLEKVFNALDLAKEPVKPFEGGDYERLVARRLAYPSGNLNEYTEYFKGLINTSKSITQGPFILIGYDGLPKKDSTEKSQKHELFPTERVSQDSVPEPELPKKLNELISYLKNTYQIKNPDYYMPIYLYESALTEEGYQGFSHFAKKIHGRESGGRISYYNPIDLSVVAWTATGNGPLYHEIVHAMITQDYPEIPGWLNEGFASMFEECGHQFVPQDNYRLIYLKQATKYRKMLSIRELLDAKRSDFEQSEQSSLYAATARYFAMYLREKGWLNSIYTELKAVNTNDPETVSNVLVQKTGYGLSALNIQFNSWLNYQQESSKWSELQSDIKSYIKGL